MMRQVLAGLAAMWLAGGATAADGPSLSIQLNKLETIDTGCRIVFVLQNDGPDAYDQLTVDLVTFDQAGLVGQRVLIELGPLRATKMSVSSFDFEAIECAAIHRVLINDITTCRTPAGPVEDCIARIALSSLGTELLF